MDTSGHDRPGGEVHATDGIGVVVDQERLVDDERIHNEYLPRCCRQAAGALVEVLEIGGFEAEVGPDRGRMEFPWHKRQFAAGVLRSWD